MAAKFRKYPLKIDHLTHDQKWLLFEQVMYDIIMQIERKERGQKVYKNIKSTQFPMNLLPRQRIFQIEGFGFKHANALLLSLMPKMVRIMGLEDYKRPIWVNTLSKAAAFLKWKFWGLTKEHFHLLCLDKRGRLIDDVFMQEGDVNSAPFYPREILVQVARTKCYALVLAHNHPGGSLVPSQSDINCTTHAISMLTPLNVILLDHLIFTDSTVVSFQEAGMLPKGSRPEFAEKDRLNTRWLDTEFLV